MLLPVAGTPSLAVEQEQPETGRRVRDDTAFGQINQSAHPTNLLNGRVSRQAEAIQDDLSLPGSTTYGRSKTTFWQFVTQMTMSPGQESAGGSFSGSSEVPVFLENHTTSYASRHCGHRQPRSVGL